MQLWRLDNTLWRVGEPGPQRCDQKDLFKQLDVTLPRLVADADARSESRMVDQLTGMLGQKPHEFWKLGQLPDLHDVPEIAHEDRGEVGSCPILPPPLALAGHRFGKPAEQNGVDEIVTDNRFALILRLPFEQTLQKARCPPLDLGPRERQHPECLHPAGQAVGDPWHGQHIGRAREKKTAWAIILIDRLLDRQKQVGRTLNLVDGDPVQTPDEPGRIGSGRIKHCLVIERDVGAVGFLHALDERGLARPARSHDKNHGRIRKSLLGPAFQKPLEHPIPQSRQLELSVSADWKSRVR